MTQEQIKKARAIRRRRVRERQAVIFGTLAATLGVIALWAVAVYNDAIGLPFDPGFSYEEQAQDEVFPTACLPDKTLPLGAKKIAVNVYNASEKNGFAGIVANDLKKRGLNVKETGNAEAKRNTTAIIFGIDGIRAAYTLHAHVPSAALILDDTREGKTIDIHIGEKLQVTPAIRLH
ncbi:LytR C-terminal domain-containing protein [Timonella sp. A28]|uniref:LytR C-terminal domain-containing protein n=1 Tax=Timonella sp. A28 TaxID=3442640 RepID=UPI003EC055DD